MRVLTTSEYCALTAGPQTVVPEEEFEALLARGLIEIIGRDPVAGLRWTNITSLGYLAKRVYESAHAVHGVSP